MEKLFISCPMRGRSDAEIKATMEQMIFRLIHTMTQKKKP